MSFYGWKGTLARFAMNQALYGGANYLKRKFAGGGGRGRKKAYRRRKFQGGRPRVGGARSRVVRRPRVPGRIRKKYGKSSKARRSRFLHNKYGQLGPQITFSTVAAGRIAVGTQGQQVITGGADWDYTASTTLCSLLGAAQMQAIHDGCGVQPIDDAVGNALPAAATYVQPDRTLLRQATAETTITSASSENIFYELYYCVARHDIPSGPFSSPNDILNKGFVQTQSNVGSIASGALSQTVFESNTFCKMFKVYKVKKGMLRSGQSMQIRLTRNRDMLLDTARYAYKSGLTGVVSFTRMVEMLAGISKMVFIRLVSGPMADTTVNTSVSVGTAAIDFVTKYRFIVNSIVSGSNINRGLASTYAGGSFNDTGKTALSLQNMGEATDAKVPEVDI